MKKLMKKKVNLFGKEFSLFAIVLLGFAVMASAALIPYFGLITGHVTVTQGLLVDGLSVATGSGSIQDSYNDFTSLQSPTYVRMHELENNANVQANGVLNTDCNTENISDNCNSVDYRAVEYFDNASADFSGYTHPACTKTVTSGNSIQSTLNTASSGNVICVNSGTYNGDVTIPTNVELVALNSPNSTDNTTITGTVTLGEGSTLKGFVISGSTGADSVTVENSDTTVDSNIIEGMVGTGSSINAIRVASYSSATLVSNVLVTNNLIQDLSNTGKGANGVMIQGNVDGVNVTYNTIKNIITQNSTPAGWDYAMGIQDSTSGSTEMNMISPKNLVIEYNTLNKIQSVKEPGRGFGVDEASSTNYADASEVTLKYNNFLNIPNDLTNKDHANHTLVAKDNFFDELAYNVNGVAKDEIYSIDADWMTKTNFSIAPHGVDKFATLASFPKMLYPDKYTLNTTVTA